MGDVDQIVCFNPPLDPGFPQGTPVNGVIGPDLHIIVYLDCAHLRNFVVSLPVGGKTESIASMTLPAWTITRLRCGSAHDGDVE